VSLALAFNYGLYHFALWKLPQDPRLLGIPGFEVTAVAKETALEFLTGFIVEKSLSVDNIFVFVLIFNFFAMPAKYQHRVLFFGILGALVFRAIFIVLGSALLQFHWVVWIFGLFLIASGLKIMLAPEKGIDPEKNPVVRLFRRFVPVTPALHGQRFFVRLNGVLHATPLFVTLLFVEVTDIIFAVDSVPAIYALTGEPLVVFVSNVFAILGLRALYFLLAGMMDRFYILHAEVRSCRGVDLRRPEDRVAQWTIRWQVPDHDLARLHRRRDSSVCGRVVGVSPPCLVAGDASGATTEGLKERASMKWSWQIGTRFGIGVYMHATFLLLLGWVALSRW